MHRTISLMLIWISGFLMGWWCALRATKPERDRGNAEILQDKIFINNKGDKNERQDTYCLYY
jgi:hypothetical protein